MKSIVLLSLAMFMLGPSDSELDALLKTEQEFSRAWMADNAHQAFSSYASDDVSLLAPGSELITGHTAVTAHIAKEPARKLIGWHTLRAGVARGSDLGYTAGAFESAAQGAQKSEHAVYLFAWKKDGGSWKIAAIVRNPAEGPPAPGLKLIRTHPPENRSDRVDADSAKAAIIKADTDFSNLSQKTNAPEAFAAYIAGDGTLLGVITEPVSGGQAVRTQFPPSPRKGVLAWKPVKADMSSTGDLGYTIGRAEFKGEDREGKPVTGYTKYLTIWIRQADGSWKYIIDGGNSAPAPAAKI